MIYIAVIVVFLSVFIIANMPDWETPLVLILFGGLLYGVLERATKLTGVKEKASLVRLGLEALIARESAKRLAKMGAKLKGLEPIPRRRSERTK
jgi:hypothetical protein